MIMIMHPDNRSMSGKRENQKDTGGPSKPLQGSSHEPPSAQSQDITKHQVKRKREMTDLHVMYVGSSDTKEMVKRRKRKQDGEEQEEDYDLKRRNTDACIERQEDQENGETFTKKRRKKKEECSEEANEITADASSSVVLHPRHKEKSKKSHKAKDFNRLISDEDFTKEAPHIDSNHVEGRFKKKKKTKKDCKERVMEDESVKVLHQGGGGFYEDEMENTRTLEQEYESFKKKKRKDKPYLQGDDCTVDETSATGLQIMRSQKSEARLQRHDGFTEETLNSELRSKKKHRKAFREDALVEVSSSSHAQYTSKMKKRRKDGEDESAEQTCVTEVIATKKKNEDAAGNTEQEAGSVVFSDNSVKEQLVLKNKQKKKRKDDAELQEDANIDQAEDHLVTEQLIPEIHHKKKKKNRKDDAELQEDGVNIDQAENHLVPEQLIPEIQHKKKKNKKRKDDAELQEDGVNIDQAEDDIVTEQLIPEIQHKKKKKEKAEG
ncbi:uncharacterized protein [Engystomops pustulosus]|uniref:uncharacterized protein isoform X2 n=1 Tax=Engystomops pustulosus TaxID=76066 RepID=UPI003AFB5E0F